MSGTKVDEIAVEGISLDKSEVTIKKGSSYTLKPTITPENATNKLIDWSSEDEDIAKVENGKITAIAVGTTTITATTRDGEHTATCKVTVTQSTTTENKEKTQTKVVKTTESEKETQKKAETDNTVANEKIPQTGSHAYIIIGAVFALGIIGFITYKKVKYLNFK